MTEPLSDRRAAAIAGTLVAAVVIVLGFGSGIGAVLSRGSAGATASPAGGRDLGTAVQGAGASTPAGDSSSGSGAHTVALTAGRSSGFGSSGAASPYDVMTPDAMAAASSSETASGGGADPSATPASPASPAGSGSPSAPSCSGASLEAAMVEPFWMHFKSAHLETSPGDQAASALNVDQYTKTHTVLIENMIAPGIDTILASLTGVQPFWMHFKTAHLETSPGDQVAGAADVDQYTKTHTVLVENMAAPAMHDATDYGCP